METDLTTSHHSESPIQDESYSSESPPQDERPWKKMVYMDKTVPMENQVKKLLKHLLLENPEVICLLDYVDSIGLGDKKKLLFDILSSTSYRKVVFSELLDLHSDNQTDERIINSLESLRKNPELGKELQFLPDHLERPRKPVGHLESVLWTAVKHLLLENPEMDEVHMKTILLSGSNLEDIRQMHPNTRESVEILFDRLMGSLLYKNPDLDKEDMLRALYLVRPEDQEKWNQLVRKLLEHLLLESPWLTEKSTSIILFSKLWFSYAVTPTISSVFSVFTRKDDLPLSKLRMMVENLLNVLVSKNSKLDKEALLDVLYSKSSREKLDEMLGIAGRMDLDYADCIVSPSCSEKLKELGKAVSRLAYGQKGLAKYCHDELLTKMCYPLPEDSICEMPGLKDQLGCLWGNLDLPLLFGRGECTLTDVASFNDLKACADSKPRNVVSLLSSDTDGEQTLVDQARELVVLKPDTFENKTVLVCCINAPVLFAQHGCQSFLNLCNELSECRRDVEMVMVARMNVLADAKDVFEHLFSGFPRSCLAVPYEDWERREGIWKVFKGDPYGIQCLVFGPDGFFLTSFFIDDYDNLYRAEAFPFTEEMWENKREELKQLREDSLEKLLKPYGTSPAAVVYELNSDQEKFSMSEVVKGKHVGLYVCCVGGLIPRLQQVYLQCKKNGEDFEIVVLYLPLVSEIDPCVFKDKIESKLKKRKVHGWWCLPFNNTVSMRFWALTRDYNLGYECSAELEDMLIIVGPDGKILDMYGGDLIQTRGWVIPHPFTRKAIVENRMKEMRELRLEPLLVGEQLFRGFDPLVTIDGKDLLNMKKKIIIFMGKPHECVNGLKRLVSQYAMMGEEGGFEVVFIEVPRIRIQRGGVEIEVEAEDKPVTKEAFANMPWYVLCPLGGTNTLLAKKLKDLVSVTEYSKVESLVGFGEDGRICSVNLVPHNYENAEFCLVDSPVGLEDDIHRLFCFDEYADI